MMSGAPAEPHPGQGIGGEDGEHDGQRGMRDRDQEAVADPAQHRDRSSSPRMRWCAPSVGSRGEQAEVRGDPAAPRAS